MRFFFTVLIVITVLAGTAGAQSSDRKIGIGAMLGDPTGVSFSYWTGPTRSFAGASAWVFHGDASLHLHMDYLFHRFDIIEYTQGSLPLYYGIGGRLLFDNQDKVGIRFPLGIAYHFEHEPLEVFFEIVPILELMPATGLSGNGGVGIRYYFR